MLLLLQKLLLQPVLLPATADVHSPYQRLHAIRIPSIETVAIAAAYKPTVIECDAF